MEIILEILLLPVEGLLQACVGVLWPSDNPDIRRLQRIALVLASAGVLSLVGGTILLATQIRSLPLFAAAYLLLLGAGFIGSSPGSIALRARADSVSTLLSASETLLDFFHKTRTMSPAAPSTRRPEQLLNVGSANRAQNDQ